MSDECDPSTYTQHTSEWTENTARYFKLVLKPPTAPQSDNITRLYYFAALLQKNSPTPIVWSSTTAHAQ